VAETDDLKRRIIAEKVRRERQRRAAPTAAPAPAAPRSLRDRIIDNVVGRDDGVMSFGEKVGAALNKGGESATLGLVGDEADAAIESALTGATYDQRLQHHRGAEAQLEAENPLTALGAEIGGAMLPVGAVGMGLRGAGMGARMLWSGLAGAGQAGTYGFMEGEGGADRVRDAGVNALIGGGVGAMVPPAISAVRHAAAPVVNSAMSALGFGNANRASRALGTMVDRSGQSVDDLSGAVRQAAADGQPEFMLADALGHPGQRALSGLARRPGDGRTEIVNALMARQEGQGERLGSFLADGFGSQRSAAATSASLTAARGTAADAAYGAARRNAGPVDVRGALAAIDDRLGPMRDGQGVAGGPIDARLAQFRARLAGDGTELSDFSRVMDVRRDIQDAVGEATRSGRNNEARLLSQVSRELDGALEGASPDYRAANDGFATSSRVIEAVDEGAEMARPSTRAADNLARFGAMTADEQAAARVGYGDRQMARVEAQAGPLTNRARPFTSAGSEAERRGMAINPDLLGRRIDRENVMFDTTRQALGGSQTADNLADAAESAGYDSNAIVNLLTGNFGTGARQILQAVGHGARGHNEETRQIIARALLSREPGQALARAAERTNSDATRRAIVEALAAASGQRVGHLMSQNP
jgi:hypothetical protein